MGAAIETCCIAIKTCLLIYQDKRQFQKFLSVWEFGNYFYRLTPTRFLHISVYASVLVHGRALKKNILPSYCKIQKPILHLSSQAHISTVSH